ncbi:MAG TPA: hypothetical protein VGS19_22900 [Streptosporangiaceae bacterium]|nr:hypothetical protein [Streptosporangiaceae bacterium]
MLSSTDASRATRADHRHHTVRHHTVRHHILTSHYGPRQIAWMLLPRFNWAQYQFNYLDALWDRESGWNRYACNPYSGAYGIPQALPGNRMGAGWHWNAMAQILWGLRYIRARYGSPQLAWYHEEAYDWY